MVHPPPGQVALALKQALESAFAAHRNGQLLEAERLYAQVLRAKPDHFDALHMLGLLRHQQERNDEALELIVAALRLRPGSAWALTSQGLVLAALKRSADALASYNRALSLTPDDPETL